MPNKNQKHLLIVANIPSENTRLMRDSVLKGATVAETGQLSVTALSPFSATPPDVKNADGIILGTTENFGYMAGATKDFFDRCYNELLGNSQGLPVFYYIRAGLDGEGTVRAIDKILLGLKWRQVLKPIVLKGNWDNDFKNRVAEASLNFAIGIEEGIY